MRDPDLVRSRSAGGSLLGATGPLLLLLFAIGCARSQSAAPEQKGPAPVASVGAAVHEPRTNAALTTPQLLTLGMPLPDVSGTAQTGELVKLSDLKGKPVVVYFYPKDDTPGCTVEAQEIRDAWQDIQKTQALVVGVSSDDDASHRAFAEKHALPFLLLPDPDHHIARAFGVALNEKGRTVRTSFVFGRDGRLVKVFPAVTPKGHGRELLETLQALPAR
ncbi:MAG TPA: peroxiredoxin [Polyangiaceae bacterium]|jgi:peroxiredoxin Q/BCP|nr:peroxiredoxin [Polyangiaceae bacterium]